MKNFQENIQLMVFINEFIGQEQQTAKKQPFTYDLWKSYLKKFCQFSGKRICRSLF